MPGSKNIRVFSFGFFSPDNNGRKKEAEICAKLGVLSGSDWTWSSDSTCFWLSERSNYYSHRCDSCKASFNYPKEIVTCPICNNLSLKNKQVSLGKIESATSREWSSTMNKNSEVDSHYVVAAKEDLKANPIPEATFDWGHLKDNL